MLLGLSPITFLMVFGMPLIGLVLGLIYAWKFNETSEEWGVLDNLFKKSK